VFDEEEEIANATRAAIVNERTLQRERVSVGNQANPADLDVP
jgi:hypothetical protein